MGAILAGATDEQREGLAAFARPLGVAFQLRDDLLGTFGDPKTTGKPAWNDIRQGKRTALIAEIAGDAEAERLLPRALGREDAREDDVAALVARMQACGARARVEQRLVALLDDARARLERRARTAKGRGLLLGAVMALGDRER